jgi:hypothetical protein
MHFYKYFQSRGIILHQHVSVTSVTIIILSKQEYHQYTNSCIEV